MLEFLAEKKVYDEKEMLQARQELLGETYMVDFAIDIYTALHESEEVPKEMVEKRLQVLEMLERQDEVIKPVRDIISNPEVQEHLDSGRQDPAQFENILAQNGFKPEMIDTLYEYSKLQYDCGLYQQASDYLYFYKTVAPPDNKHADSALWGKLSSEILLQNWDTALEDLLALRRRIEEANKQSPLVVLQQRTWLIHWSLYVYFNHEKGPEDIINFFLYEQHYLNAIQTTCPHILRYLTAAVVISKRRQVILKDLVKVIRQESYAYKDPITEFIECLYVDFDFSGAQEKLAECEKVLDGDFFLVSCKSEFIENARLSIFETFCRIHQCISISMLAQKLNMDPESAERWIVNLIRNVRLDAKIDAVKGHVVMAAQSQSVYQRVIDKTKPVAFQSQLISQSVEKRLESQRQQQRQAKLFPPDE